MLPTMCRRGCFRRFLSFTIVLAFAVASVSATHSTARADAGGAGGDFVPLSTAAKLYDTATGAGGAAAGGMTAGQVVSFPALGVGAVPAEGVSSLLVQISASTATATTYLTVYQPEGGRHISNLNVPVNSTGVTTSTVVSPGADGTLSLFNSVGTVKVSVAVEGYYSTDYSASGSGGFVPVPTTTIVDTRTGVGVAKAQIGSKKSVTVTVTGGVIPTGTVSVFVNAFVVNATATGSLSNGNGASINYLTGSTTSAMLAKANSAGQLTFTNNGLAAIDLALTTNGYSAPSPTVGAGWRPAQPFRLLSNALVAKSSTLDVQVLGVGGLPTRGLTSVALGVDVVNGSIAGQIRVWGAGSTEPNQVVLTYPPSVTASAFTIVSPGPTGAIRLHNLSTTTDVRVYVDFFAMYGDPLGYAPPVSESPTSLVQMSGDATNPGAIEYAYTDDYGQMYHGYQADPADFQNIQWTPDQDQETYSGQPALAALPSNTVLAAIQHYDTDIYTTTSPSGPDWSSPFGDGGGSMAAPPVAAALPDGSGIIFAVDTDGTLWVDALAASPRYWRKVITGDLVGTPVLTPIAGGVQVTGVTRSGGVKTASYKSGVLSAWTQLGGTVLGRPAVVAAATGLLDVLAEQADGQVIIKTQTTGGAWPATWSTVGTFSAGGSPAAALAASGALVVLDRDPDGYVYESDETAAGSGTFSTWLRVGGQTDPAATDVSITALSGMPNGWAWLGVYRTIDNSTRVIVTAPSNPSSTAVSQAIPSPAR